MENDRVAAHSWFNGDDFQSSISRWLRPAGAQHKTSSGQTALAHRSSSSGGGSNGDRLSTPLFSLSTSPSHPSFFPLSLSSLCISFFLYVQYILSFLSSCCLSVGRLLLRSFGLFLLMMYMCVCNFTRCHIGILYGHFSYFFFNVFLFLMGDFLNSRRKKSTKWGGSSRVTSLWYVWL